MLELGVLDNETAFATALLVGDSGFFFFLTTLSRFG
jgi:hypothetical protein